MKFVFFFYECYPLPLAYHLQQEGYDVILGAVPSLDYLKLPDVKNEEKPAERFQRHSTYRGILNKQTADEVLKYLSRVPKAQRDDHFIFFDFNDMYHISEQVLKMGYRKGLFPTEWYYRMEKERALAKSFVKKHYPDIKVAPAKSFKSAQDGINFLKETDKVHVLKSNGNQAATRVPKTDDPDEGREILTKALMKDRKGYEAGGFLMEEKIPNCQEVTPVMMFYDGKPVYSIVEFESKSLGAHDIGLQKGGNLALSVKTEMKCKLNEMSFPPVIYELARKQPGMAVFDIGLLYNGEDFYFTEFCAMRYGWDGVFSELVMRDDGKPFVANYFLDLMAKKNPIINQYGASVRMFNLGGHMEGVDKSEDDIEVVLKPKSKNNVFFYRIKKQGKDWVSVGGLDLLGVATGASNVLETAVGKAYQCIENVRFESLYHRPQEDFLSLEYKSSIPNRFTAVKKFLEEEK